VLQKFVLDIFYLQRFQDGHLILQIDGVKFIKHIGEMVLHRVNVFIGMLLMKKVNM
jgi:hypothetical protein